MTTRRRARPTCFTPWNRRPRSVWAGGLLSGHKQAPVSGGAIPVQRLLSCPASYAHQAPWVPAQVSILIGCHPAIDNGDLQASNASSVMPVVRQLLNPR
jgi:hypothetical protein